MEEDLSKSTQTMLCGLYLCIASVILLFIVGILFEDLSVYTKRASIAIAVVYALSSFVFKVIEMILERKYMCAAKERKHNGQE